MKKFIILFLLFLLAFSAGSAHSQEDTLSNAEAEFRANQYKKGMAILKKALRDRNTDTEKQAEVLNRLAKCFEELTGDIKQASAYYTRTLRTSLPADHPLKLRAREELNRLKSLGQKYAAEDKAFNSIRNISFRMKKEPQIKKQIKDMEKIAKANPHYYRLAEVFFMIGMYHLALREYKEAYEYMDKSMEEKPGISLKFPVKARREEAFGYYSRISTSKFYKRLVSGVAAVLLGITLIMFFISAPWKWMKFRQLTAGFIIMLAWPCAFYLSLMVLEKYTNPKEIINTEAYAGSRSLLASKELIADTKNTINSLVMSGANPDIHTKPTQAGGRVLNILCAYGLVGIAWVFVFSAGTGRLKNRHAAFLMNLLFASVLFAALTADFYIRHCYWDGALYGEKLKANILYYISIGIF